VNGKSAVERAFDLARTGQFENFTAVKRALRYEFHVERELVGRSLSAAVTAACREARTTIRGAPETNESRAP
jgi:hypothetical protein